MQMTLYKSTHLLVTILIAITLVVTAVSNYMLYRTALLQQKERLTETVQGQTRLIEAVAEFDAIYSAEDDFQGNSELATLSQIRKALDGYEGFGKTGEFTLARKKDNHIQYLLVHRHHTHLPEEHESVPLDGHLAVAMQRALLGQSGTSVGLDYRGVKVLAAFQPVKFLNYGMVAKIDMAEIREPFIYSFMVSIGMAALFIAAGAAAFYYITTPLIHRITSSENKLRLILNSTDEGIFGMDKQGHCIFVNSASLNLLGYDHPDEVLGHNMHDLIHHHYPDGRLYPFEQCALMLALQSEVQTEMHNEIYWRRDGSFFDTESRMFPIYERNRFSGAVVIFQDITALKENEALRRLATSVYENVQEGIMVTDAETQIISVNQAFTDITGYTSAEVIGKTPRMLRSGRQDKAFYKKLWHVINTEGVWKGEIWNRKRKAVRYTRSGKPSWWLKGRMALLSTIWRPFRISHP